MDAPGGRRPGEDWRDVIHGERSGLPGRPDLDPARERAARPARAGITHATAP